jgi:hypothetical protein
MMTAQERGRFRRLKRSGTRESCADDAARALAAAPHLQRLRRLCLGALSYLRRLPTQQAYEALQARFGEEVVTRN